MDATLLDLRRKRIGFTRKKTWHPSQTVRDFWPRSAARSRQGLPALPIRGSCQQTISAEKSSKLYPIARLERSERSGHIAHLLASPGPKHRLRLSGEPK